MRNACSGCKSWAPIQVEGYGFTGQCNQWMLNDGSPAPMSHDDLCSRFNPTDAHVKEFEKWMTVEVGTWPEWKRKVAATVLRKPKESK